MSWFPGSICHDVTTFVIVQSWYSRWSHCWTFKQKSMISQSSPKLQSQLCGPTTAGWQVVRPDLLTPEDLDHSVSLQVVICPLPKFLNLPIAPGCCSGVRKTSSPHLLIVTPSPHCHLISSLSPHLLILTSCPHCHLISSLSPHLLIVTPYLHCHLISSLSPYLLIVTSSDIPCHNSQVSHYTWYIPLVPCVHYKG